MRISIMYLFAASLLAASPALSQHTIEVTPNPFDGAIHDTLTVRNAGGVPVAIDSLRFASSLEYGTGFGWSFQYVANLDGEDYWGDVLCDPLMGRPCEDGSLTPLLTTRPFDRDETVVAFNLEAYCAVCRGVETIPDTLLVYAGGSDLPLEVPLQGRLAINVEGGGAPPVFFTEVFPNPASHQANVLVRQEAAATIEIRIIDVTGRVVANETPGVVSVGETLVPLNVSSLSAGTYYVEVRTVGAGSTPVSSAMPLVIVR